MFLSNLEGKIDSLSSAELLEEAGKDSQLRSAYKEIRQEVQMTPVMCITHYLLLFFVTFNCLSPSLHTYVHCRLIFSQP